MSELHRVYDSCKPVESVRVMEMPSLMSEDDLQWGRIQWLEGHTAGIKEAEERIAKAEQERNTLQATVTRLSAPVRDEEIERYKWGFPDVVRDRFSEILRARTDQESKPSKEGQNARVEANTKTE